MTPLTLGLSRRISLFLAKNNKTRPTTPIARSELPSYRAVEFRRRPFPPGPRMEDYLRWRHGYEAPCHSEGRSSAHSTPAGSAYLSPVHPPIGEVKLQILVGIIRPRGWNTADHLTIQNERDIRNSVWMAIHPGLQVLKADIEMIAQMARMPRSVTGPTMCFATENQIRRPRTDPQTLARAEWPFAARDSAQAPAAVCAKPRVCGRQAIKKIMPARSSNAPKRFLPIIDFIYLAFMQSFLSVATSYVESCRPRYCLPEKSDGRADPPSRTLLTLAMVWWPSFPPHAKSRYTTGRPPAWTVSPAV